MGRRPTTAGLRSEAGLNGSAKSPWHRDHRLAPLPRPPGWPARHPARTAPGRGRPAASKPPRDEHPDKQGAAERALLEERGDVEIVVVPKVEAGAGQLHLCVKQAQGPAGDRSGAVIRPVGPLNRPLGRSRPR